MFTRSNKLTSEFRTWQPFDDDKKEKFAILKNVLLISFGFTLLFTAYNSAAALQSSVNKVMTPNISLGRRKK
jgi:hypothetical protein